MNGTCNRCDNDKQTLYRNINEVSFVLDDLRLYIDTHYDCADAISMYEDLSILRRKLVEEYTKKYGAIEAYYPGTDGGWGWNTEKMPWEGDK